MIPSPQELCELVFSQEGMLGKALPGFQERQEQKKMALVVLQAYAQDNIALVEAGTGTGKSWAYLVAAFYHALHSQTTTVIATKTIALQEQLLLKDIPFLLNTLGLDLKVSLVKGMSNYVCLRKLHEQLDEQPLLSLKEIDELERIDHEEKGTFSEFSFTVSSEVKEKVSANFESCNHVQCPFYKNCFFFKERNAAQDSQVLIVNHHLLLADLQKKVMSSSQEARVFGIPAFDRLLIDEAHHFEPVALESLAERWQRLEMVKGLSKLYSDHERSLLSSVKKLLLANTQVTLTSVKLLEIDFPAYKQTCFLHLDGFSLRFRELLATLSDEPSGKCRITQALLAHPLYTAVLQSALLCADHIERFSLALQSFLSTLESYKDLPWFSSLTAFTVEISSIADRMEQSAAMLKNFFSPEASSDVERNIVRWIEWSPNDLLLVRGSLDVSTLLSTHLFSKLKTALLCSATLAVGPSFEVLKQRLGLMPHNHRVQELVVSSPFDYKERTLFSVPLDLPLPSSEPFFAACVATIKQMIDISKGSVLILLTSYEMLRNMYQALSGIDYPLLYQGQMPRHLLLEQFRQQKGSVLLATDSFWEGVDVPGEALRCVIIVKLPFSVPSDPLYEAYSEALQRAGKDPFMEHAIPQAVIKFKQGFGRLMRHHRDRGCVVCLDHRIVKKRYGRYFLDSLPACKVHTGTTAEVLVEMKQFYQDTGGVQSF